MMSVANTSTLIQRVITGRAAAGGPRREVPARPNGEAVYFKLQLIDPSIELKPFDIAALEAGGEYRIRVSASLHGQADQSPIYATAPILLKIRCKEVPALATAERRVDADAILAFDEEFELKVPANFPTGEYELTLLWLYEGETRAAPPVTSLSVQIEEAEDHVDSEQLRTTCHIALNAELPPNTAILYIESDHDKSYHLAGWSSHGRLLRTPPIEPPTYGLADFVEAGFAPKKIRGEISRRSRTNNYELLEWLTRLYKRHGKNLCLILADHSASELPWEMMKIQDHLCLGAIWKIVRWIPVRNYLLWQELQVQSQEISGTVLAYLNEEVTKEVEVGALNKFTTSFCKDTDLLMETLSQPLDTVAVVYLGCHGIFTANDEHAAAIGGLENPSRNILALDIELIDNHKGARPLLFVNACHSARLINRSGRFIGLLEVFLARVANSYLGTLGPVGSAQAAEIAKRIFDKALTGTVEPAEILRELRAEAIAKLAASESKENWLNFIYTFMYVFYGNPFIKIKLVAAGEENK
jgi:hypothetical protein